MSGADEPLPPEEFRALISDALPPFGLPDAPARIEPLARFLSELDQARRKTNLTGRLSASDLVLHALESALGELFLPTGAAVVDIGTGGGFPGVPPENGWFHHFLQPVVGGAAGEHAGSAGIIMTLMVVATAIALAGWGLAHSMYSGQSHLADSLSSRASGL